MGKLLSSAVLVFSVSILYSWGQIKKQFTVESPEACKAVELHLKAKSAIALFVPARQPTFSTFTATRILKNTVIPSKRK